MNVLGLIICVLCLGIAICFLSVLQASVGALSRVTLRVLADKESSSQPLLSGLADNPRHFLVPVEFGIQVMQVAAAVLVTASLVMSGQQYPYLASTVILILGVYLLRQLLPKMITQRNPDKVLLFVLRLFRPGYVLLHWISFPLVTTLRLFQERSDKLDNGEEEEEEPSEEEIQAYIDVGEEEGIFEEEESELIQSALEFGNTLVREIMTPRSEITAIEETAKISEAKTLFISSKHSRLPVYRERLDQIVGVIYVRHLLAMLETASDDDPILPLLNRPWFVPETKRVAELLKEMQANAEHIAIVINEYGAVSGLVTIEDLVEEIVGDIRDEDELLRVNLSYEGDGTYVARGVLTLEELEDALEIDLGDPDVSTLSGLVVANLARVPHIGEQFTLYGLEIEILSADRRRIHTLRIRKTPVPEQAPTGKNGRDAI